MSEFINCAGYGEHLALVGGLVLAQPETPVDLLLCGNRGRPPQLQLVAAADVDEAELRGVRLSRSSGGVAGLTAGDH